MMTTVSPTEKVKDVICSLVYFGSRALRQRGSVYMGMSPLAASLSV